MWLGFGSFFAFLPIVGAKGTLKMPVIGFKLWLKFHRRMRVEVFVRGKAGLGTFVSSAYESIRSLCMASTANDDEKIHITITCMCSSASWDANTN